MNKKAVGAALVSAIIILPALAMGPGSGLAKGEVVTPFHPKHVAGPDKGTDTCPPCKYGSRPAVQVWVNNDDFKNMEKMTLALSEAVARASDAQLKAFVIKLTPAEATARVKQQLEALAQAKKIENVGIAYLTKNDEAVKNYKVNTSEDVRNTVFLYRNKKVEEKFVNFVADDKGIAQLQEAIKQITINPEE